MAIVQQFWQGLWAPLGALKFLRRHRGLKRYMVLPVFVNMLVFIGLYVLAWMQIDDILAGISTRGDAWYWGVLYYVTVVLVLLLLAVVAGLVTALLAGVIAGPFNDALAERTLEIVDGRARSQGFSLAFLGKESVRIIMQQIKKLVFLLICAGLLFLLNFIPGMALLVQFFLYPVFLAFAAALEFMDYGMERRRLTFKQKRRFLYRRPGLVFGFGGGSVVLLMVPVVNFLLMPVLVVAGSLLYLSMESGMRR